MSALIRSSTQSQWRPWTLAAPLLLVLALAGCGQEAPRARGPVYGDAPRDARVRVYTLAVHPLHNPAMLVQAYQPLADYLTANIPGSRFQVEASRDYADFERKFRARGPELLLPNPWQTLEAMKAGYGVLAMAGDAADFKGLLIVRSDSPIRQVRDLKGKAVAYPSPTALAACIMPQWYLHERGLDVNRDIVNRYVGSQESAIMNAYLGQADVGVTWPPPWRAFAKAHPQAAAQLRVLWETPPLLNNSVMARHDLPAGLRQRLGELLAGLHEGEAGRRILAGMETARFHPAGDRDYDRVRQFVDRFERQVRKVESP